MRPAVLPVEAAPPCCSGRGVAEAGPRGPRWPLQRRCTTRASLQRPQQPERHLAAGSGRAAAPPPARSFAGALGSLASSGTIVEVEESEQQQQQRQKEQQQDQLEQQERAQQSAAAPPSANNGMRDGNGLLRNRSRPLRINLDLALYRARQKRLLANSSRLGHDRAKVLREVEESLRACLALFPEDGRPYVSLGKLMVQQRRYDEALALYEEGCTATGGTNAHIWAAWAYLAAKLGNVSLARRLYDAAIVASPTHAAAWHGWGLLEKDQGNFLRARDLWLQGIQALRKSPNPYLYQSLAVLAADMDCTEEARKWFREGTRTLTGKASHALWHGWAMMEMKQGDPELVRPLLRRGLEVSPRSRYTHLSWGLWEREQGNDEEARRLFRAGSELNPRDAAILQAWAMLEEAAGAVDEARRLLRRASKVDPRHLHVWQAWGCLEYRQQNYEKARELFQQGIWATPPRAPAVSLVFQAWAVLERDAGNTGLARELLKCAVKADPKSEPSWLTWAQMEEDLGFYQRAAELRSFNMQERVEIVKPANFASYAGGAGRGDARGGLLAPIFTQITKWFQRYEESGSPSYGSRDGGSVDLPDVLPEALDVAGLAPAPVPAEAQAQAAAQVQAPSARGRSRRVPAQ